MSRPCSPTCAVSATRPVIEASRSVGRVAGAVSGRDRLSTMTLPPLYLEGLAHRAVHGPDKLNVYKLGLIEAILKDTLRGGEAQDAEALRRAMRAALDVARWEPRHPPRRA